MKAKSTYLFAFILLLYTQGAFAQQDILRLKEVVGKTPLRTQSYAEYVGTPFLSNEWAKGVVKQVSGQVIKDIYIKYDQIQDEIIFKDEKGNELAFAVLVSEFKIFYNEKGAAKTSLFRNGFIPFRGSTDKSYYEILYDGSFKLLKKNVKRIEQSRAFNSATITKTVIERVKYYTASADNKLLEFRRDSKGIKEAFGDKSLSMERFIKENNLDLKDDADLVKVFVYYSSLQ